MVTLLSRYANNLRKDRRAERSPARQTLRPPQRTLAAIPKRSLVIYTPPEARGSILRDCNHLWRHRPPHGETGANKGSICRYNMFGSLLKDSPLRTRERGPQPSAWKECSTKIALAAFWDAPCERCAEATSLSILLCYRPDAQRRSHAPTHIPRLSEIAARARLLPASYAHARWLAADHPGVGRDQRRAHIDQHHRGQSEGEERAPRSARGGQRGGPDERLAHSDGPRPGRGGYYRRCRRADRSAGQEVPQRGDLEAARIGSQLFAFDSATSDQMATPRLFDTFATRLSAQALIRSIGWIGYAPPSRSRRRKSTR